MIERLENLTKSIEKSNEGLRIACEGVKSIFKEEVKLDDQYNILKNYLGKVLELADKINQLKNDESFSLVEKDKIKKTCTVVKDGRNSFEWFNILLNEYEIKAFHNYIVNPDQNKEPLKKPKSYTDYESLHIESNLIIQELKNKLRSN